MLEDVEFLQAVRATGRRKLIICALWAEVCMACTALDVLRDGYEVYPVVDAIAGTSPEAHRAGLERVTQAGGQPIGWVSLACELQRDWARQETVPGDCRDRPHRLPDEGGVAPPCPSRVLEHEPCGARVDRARARADQGTADQEQRPAWRGKTDGDNNQHQSHDHGDRADREHARRLQPVRRQLGHHSRGEHQEQRRPGQRPQWSRPPREPGAWPDGPDGPVRSALPRSELLSPDSSDCADATAAVHPGAGGTGRGEHPPVREIQIHYSERAVVSVRLSPLGPGAIRCRAGRRRFGRGRRGRRPGRSS